MSPALRMLSLVVFGSLASCTSSNSGGSSATPGGGEGGDTKPSNPFAPSIKATRVAIEIDYQRGAEPYTGSTLPFGDPWRVFQTNATKLLEGTGRSLEVPTTLDKMQAIEVEGAQFSADDILTIAATHRATKTQGDVIAYYVVWLAGYFEQDGAANKQVLGVSIGNSGVIAMFKPVIESSGIALAPDIARVVEQTVLVHEFGHTIGLVANGVPLTSAHHDAPHGAHCTNEKCVMYWSVEGVASARDFAQKRVTNGDTVLFGDECLADVVAAGR